ncbi:hypothetical protein ABIE21_001062 [Conyzicola nivalis]|uniref:Bacterial mobilisation domain-containing protein n=1 Tax=Conyzicola nivalis TaxID=1477021 RepID=A0ABV2QKU1_9MICO
MAPATRHHRIDTRFSESELAMVERVARRNGLAPSAFVRGAACDAANALEGRPPVEQNRPALSAATLTAAQLAIIDAARIEVKRIGVNLNQLVRASHQGDFDLGALTPVIEALVVEVVRAISLLGGKGQP